MCMYRARVECLYVLWETQIYMIVCMNDELLNTIDQEWSGPFPEVRNEVRRCLRARRNIMFIRDQR